MRRPVSLSTPAWAKVGIVRAARTANTKALVFVVFTPLVRRRIPLAQRTMPAGLARRCDVGHAKRHRSGGAAWINHSDAGTWRGAVESRLPRCDGASESSRPHLRLAIAAE